MRAREKENNDMVREEQLPTIEMQGEQYYGLSGLADCVVDLMLVDKDPCPLVALGIKDMEDYRERHQKVGSRRSGE